MDQNLDMDSMDSQKHTQKKKHRLRIVRSIPNQKNKQKHRLPNFQHMSDPSESCGKHLPLGWKDGILSGCGGLSFSLQLFGVWKQNLNKAFLVAIIFIVFFIHIYIHVNIYIYMYVRTIFAIRFSTASCFLNLILRINDWNFRSHASKGENFHDPAAHTALPGMQLATSMKNLEWKW